MEGIKQKQASSSSSFITELLGSKESYDGFFDSILSPHLKAHKKNHIRPEVTWKTDDFGNKQESVDNEEKKSQNPKSRDTNYAFWQQQQQQGASQPCPLSSSLHYGGQEIYTTPAPIAHHAATHSTNNTGGEDVDGHASGGNWWLGGVHY